MYTIEEVCKHNKKDDCWIVISGKVYDVTPFLEDHPGGDEVFLKAAGKDATNDFEDVGHSDTARDMMKDFYVGVIDSVTITEYTMQEVCKHNRKDDCWIVIFGKVYDVTSFLEDHPGGYKTILQVAGENATSEFEAIGHSEAARDLLKNFYVGFVNPYDSRTYQGERYRMWQVSRHNRKGDCWIVISRGVYDVTSFLDDHPGGDEVFLKAAGKDATIDFEDVGHSNAARDMMRNFYLGFIDK